MKKSDLKSGIHIVVFRNGRSGLMGEWDKIIFNDRLEVMELSKFNNNLTHINNNHFDIIEVSLANPIWKREEKEMIEIDGVEYEKEEIKRLLNNRCGAKTVLVPPKKEHVIEYSEGCYMFKNSIVSGGCYGTGETDLKNGNYRKTKENAEYSLKRNKRANRLEALVEDLQGDLGVGDWCVYKKDGDYLYYRCAEYIHPEIVIMKEETAEKVCELLNSEQYSLEG